MKPLKVYTLYDSPNGPSCQSVWYSKYSKKIWHVAAVSIKQAIYLAAHNSWSKGDVGIIEYTSSGSDKMWQHADNTESWGERISGAAARPVGKEELRRALRLS